VLRIYRRRAIFCLTYNLDAPNMLDMNLAPQVFRSQITEAKKRLAQLVREQRKINQEISDLRELIRANANFLPDEDRTFELLTLEVLKFPANITEAVRLSVFLATAKKTRLTPTEVRSFAEAIGFDFSEYSNPMASIHSILKRMKETNEVQYDKDTDGYYFGNTNANGDLLNPELAAELFKDVISEIVKEPTGNKIVTSAMDVATTRKAARLGRKAED
jgi:hypothetical protein